jgi:hypothetical protein
MKLANIDYTTFWSLVSSKNLAPQYTNQVDHYNIFAIEDTISWETNVSIGVGDPNQTDFETNHQSSCNQPLEIKAGVGRPLRVSASPQPDGTVEHWQGYQIDVPAGQTSGYVDISFSNTVYLRGGYIVSPDVDFGDYVGADVLIAANSAEYLPGIISSAYMIPNLPVSFESDESMAFPSSLKVRVTLTLNPAHETDTTANILVDYFE